jgi:arylsulfatase
MSGKRGEKPRELQIYGRAKRATIDREITDHAIDFMQRKTKENQPFFAYIPYTQTHDPVDPHPDYKGKTGNGRFADVLAQTDAYVGELLDTIDKLGIKENTIFIFTSDNGGDDIQESFGFNGPWRGSLFTPFEGSLRVPFLIRWPGKIPPRQVSNEIVHEMDLFATLANMVGGNIPNDRIMDSLDQSDFLMGKSEKSARESFVIYVGNEPYGVKWRNWKMLFKEIDDYAQPVRTNSYPAFYNLLIDPKEEQPIRTYITDTWIELPLWQVVEDHEASLEKDPGTPDP